MDVRVREGQGTGINLWKRQCFFFLFLFSFFAVLLSYVLAFTVNSRSVGDFFPYKLHVSNYHS